MQEYKGQIETALKETLIMLQTSPFVYVFMTKGGSAGT